MIGLRCSGKSTVGALVAQHLARPFIDLDDATAVELGQPTPALALTHLGFDAFRAGELHALVKTLANAGQVIALGGGTPTHPDSLDILIHQRNARRLAIVYLRAQPQTLKHRLAQTDTRTRPPLLGQDPVEEVVAIFAQRDTLYRQLAHRVIEVDNLPPDHAALATEAWFNHYLAG